MPRLTKIYTRTGDDGTTALGTTRRVSKDHPRIAAYGTVDELNALIGLALAQGLESGNLPQTATGGRSKTSADLSKALLDRKIYRLQAPKPQRSWPICLGMVVSGLH